MGAYGADVPTGNLQSQIEPLDWLIAEQAKDLEGLVGLLVDLPPGR